MKLNLRFITNNFWIKLTAFMLAIALWFYIAGENVVEKSMLLNINVKPAKGMAVVNQSANVSRVDIRYRKGAEKELEEKEPYIEIDLREYTEPQRLTLSIGKNDVKNLTGDAIITHIYPEKINLDIDRISEKILPVKVITTGQPAPGHKLEGYGTDPVSVRIEGPESILRNMKYIETEPVDITGRQKPFKRMVPLRKLPAGNKLTPPQFVEVFIKISGEYLYSPRK